MTRIRLTKNETIETSHFEALEKRYNDFSSVAFQKTDPSKDFFLKSPSNMLSVLYINGRNMLFLPILLLILLIIALIIASV